MSSMTGINMQSADNVFVSAAECNAYCASIPSCVGFIRNSTSGVCYFLSRGRGYQPTSGEVRYYWLQTCSDDSTGM